MPDGHERWHVEGIAQGFAPALNVGLAAPLAGLAGDGGHACQCGDGLFAQAANLGHLGHDRCGGDLKRSAFNLSHQLTADRVWAIERSTAFRENL